MLVLVAVSISRKRDTGPKLSSFILCLLSLSHGISNGFAWISFVLCTHTCTQAKGWEMCYGLIKKTVADCCSYIQTQNTYIITVVHLHNSIIFTWCINDGHPWSSYSINLTKTSVDPFSRIFAPHGGSSGVWGLEQKYLKECDTLERVSMWEPRVSLPRNPKSNFKAHHDNSMQTRSWIVVGPSIRLFAPVRDLYLTISNIIQHIYHLGAEPEPYVPAADDADLFHAGGEQHTKTREPQAPALCDPDKKRDSTDKANLSRPD